jgi:uncharacterized membrane protein
MASLIVSRYPTPEGADQALQILHRLEAEGKYHLLDGALLTWPQGRKRPTTRPVVATGMPGTLDHAFWGMLLGLLFFVPPEAAGVGADSPALHGLLGNMGIGPDFINHVRERVTEGCSALFVFRDVDDLAALHDALAHLNPEVVATNLPPDQEAGVRDMFGNH